MLKRFWFEFNIDNPFEYPTGTVIGCGVTAFSYEDAISLLQEKVFKNNVIPKIKKTVEDVDLRNLDPLHVLPNISPVIYRGVWFPQT